MKDVKEYTIKEALKQIREKGRKVNFDQSLEVHVNLSIDPQKQDQMVRFSMTLPHGTGQDVKVAVVSSEKVPSADLELSDADLKKIESGDLQPGKDFDVLVAEPRQMSKLGKLGRILGPAGAMPNPKAGTVTDEVEEAVKNIKEGKIEIRTEQTDPIIHTVVGKLSFKDKELVENFNEFIATLRQNRPPKIKPHNFIKSVYISPSMGKSYKIDIQEN